MTGLAQDIAALFEQGAAAPREAAREAFLRLRDELAAGRVRAAEPDAASPTGWRVNVWVKQGILLGFRFGDMADMSIGGQWPFSAAAQIGGVIEPVGAMPVIVEDEVLVGGNCGVYEGAVIKRRAVLASGTRTELERWIR